MKDAKEALPVALAVLLIVACVMGAIFVPLFLIERAEQRECAGFMENTGRMTHWERGCWIEIQPGLSVREVDLLLYLDHVMPVTEDAVNANP